MLISDRGSLLGLLLVSLSRFLWRHRSAMAPFTVAASAFIATAVAHPRHGAAYLPVAVGAGVVSFLLSIPHKVLRRHRAGMSAARIFSRIWAACGIDRPVERYYAAAVVAVLGGWSSAALANGPTTPPLPKIWVFSTFIGGIPWWVHRRRRARVRVERIVEDWPGLAESIGLPGSRIASAMVNAWGWTARLALRKGSTTTDAIARIPAIESALGVRNGSVRVQPDGRRADRCLIRVVEKDPHATAIPWPACRKATITKPIVLGLFEDAREVAVSILRRHVLVGGVVGSGKSGVVNVILGTLAACRDATVWGIDLKEGMELSPWRPCLGRLATTSQGAYSLLQSGVAELERRARILTEDGLRVWEPTPDHPALVIVIDEYAELPEQAREYADSIARRGRAVAVTLIVATQRPTQKTMGGATRSQMDIRICLRVRERRDTDLILGQGYSKTGWRAEALTTAGSFYISSPEHQSPERARAYLVSNEAVAGQVREHAQPPAPPAPPAQIAGAHGTALSGPQRAVEPPPHPDVRPEPERGSQDPESALWAALRSSGGKGATVGELMAACGMGRSWVYHRLRQHAEGGHAVQTSRGRWRARPPGLEGQQRPTPPGPGRTGAAERFRRRAPRRPPNRDAP